MKKLLLSALILGVMSTSAMAVWIDGKITAIQQYHGLTFISVTNTTNTYKVKVLNTLSDTDKKNILAIALTAQASGADVSLLYNGDWDSIILK